MRPGLACVVVLVAALGAGGAVRGSTVADDEQVVLFPTAAHPTDQGWTVAVRGWIFEPEAGSLKRALVQKLLARKLGLSSLPADSALAKERIRPFLVDDSWFKAVAVRMGDAADVMPRSGRDGRFDGELALPADAAPKGAGGPVWRTLAVDLPPSDARSFTGRVQFIPDEGWSVVSDVDDTVKETGVLDRAELVANTFRRPFRAVEGMPALYSLWAARGAAFHYVSGSPWQLGPALERFFDEAGLPAGSFDLRTMNLTDGTLLSATGSPFELKVATIERILARWPRRRFVLVGDAGEADPEVYGELARRHPRQVAAVFIHMIPGARHGVRFDAAFAGCPRELWRVFENPGTLPLDPVVPQSSGQGRQTTTRKP